MSDEISREKLMGMSRTKLVDLLLYSYSHVRLLQHEWGKSEQRLAELRAKHHEAVMRLEEANAVIIEASRELGIEHKAFWVLDGADGSGDACTRLYALGYRRTGDGGWYLGGGGDE